jgi:two-component system, cell cycle sensor histidine kinase and response regulator CckA
MSSGDHFGDVIASLPVCVMLLGTDGSIREVNPAGLIMVEADGFDRIRDKPFQNIVAPEFRSSFQALVRKAAEGASDSLEYQITGLLGTRRWLDTDAAPFRDSSGTVIAILTVTRDITDRVHREGKTRYDQKMEAISTLTSGIAHDFNNILTAIIGYANVIRMKLAESDPLRPLAAQILAASDRASGLTKGLLAFGSKQILSLKPVDLNDTVKRVAGTFGREADGAVTVELKLTDAALTIMADEGQIELCLMNMLANAREAMSSGGTISLTTGTMELEDTFISIHGYGTKGTYAVVTITDSGRGMDAQTKKKAFEPFFTTKDAGKGPGLGLAIVYGSIKSHRGFVNVYSEPGIGSSFRVYLPLSGIRLTDTAASSLLPEGNGETVLIAEDEAAVRKITTSVLEQFGYHVVAAADGEEAIRLFREHPGLIHLVMIDVVMPGKDGRAVYEEIMRLRPDTRVLFTSGYTADFISSKGLLDKGVPFISKPVSPRDLLIKIKEVLES